eukprot:gene19756-14354_t
MDASSATVSTLVNTLGSAFAVSEIVSDDAWASCQSALSLLLTLLEEGNGVDENDGVSTTTLQTLIATVSGFFDGNTTTFTSNELDLESVLTQLSSGVLQTMA